jgi:hypothetical protein
MSGAFVVWRATPTGLEPAASAVTGRRANQLRYGAWCVLRRKAEADGTLTHRSEPFPIVRARRSPALDDPGRRVLATSEPGVHRGDMLPA